VVVVGVAAVVVVVVEDSKVMMVVVVADAVVVESMIRESEGRIERVGSIHQQKQKQSESMERTEDMVQ